MTETTRRWLCDHPGCDQEFDIKIEGEKYCITHARDRAEQERQANVGYN